MWNKISNGVDYDLPKLPDGFSWELNYAVDEDADISFLGVSARKRPYDTWYVDRKLGELINPNGGFDDEDNYVERYPVKYNSFSRNQYEFYIPTNHNPPGSEKDWEHVEQATKDKIIAQWGSLRRQDIEYMLENHKLWEEYCDNSRQMYVYQVKLSYRGKILTFNSLGGVDTDLYDEYTQEIFSELAQECIAEFLRDRNWWLDTENLHSAYLQKKDLLMSEDSQYWDQVVERFNAAREFRRIHNNNEDWWGYRSGVVGARIQEKLDAAKATKDASTQDRSESSGRGETT